jgi:hypothetical protein
MFMLELYKGGSGALGHGGVEDEHLPRKLNQVSQWHSMAELL